MLSRNQRPKIDEYDDYLFIVLHFPVFDRTVGRLNAGELDLFVGPDFLVTIPNQPLQPVEYLFERCRQKEELREQLFSKGSGYLLYRIVDDGFDYCFPMLRKIGNKLDALEDEIFEGRSEDIVRDISNVEAGDHQLPQGDPPAADGAARPRERSSSASWPRPRASELEIYFDDIGDAHERIWDMLENYKEVVEALEETNESVISHRVNDILRVLTAISVIVLPLTLIASIWGMNVGVPGEGDQRTSTSSSGHGRDPRRHARLLPPARLAVSSGASQSRRRSPSGIDAGPSVAGARAPPGAARLAPPSRHRRGVVAVTCGRSGRRRHRAARERGPSPRWARTRSLARPSPTDLVSRRAGPVDRWGSAAARGHRAAPRRASVEQRSSTPSTFRPTIVAQALLAPAAVHPTAAQLEAHAEVLERDGENRLSSSSFSLR